MERSIFISSTSSFLQVNKKKSMQLKMQQVLLCVILGLMIYLFYYIIGTMRSEMEVHGTNEIKQFCKVCNKT